MEMSKIKEKLQLTFFIVSCVLTVNACGEKSKAADPNAVTQAGGGVIKTNAEGESALVAGAASNVQAVENSMLPGSLAIEGAALLSGGENDNPCEGTDGFFDCQPNLLKLYLGLAKSMVSLSRQLLSGAGTGLAQVPVPSSGSVEGNSDSQISKIDYVIESETAFKILMVGETKPFLNLEVDGATITIQADMSQAPDSEGDSGKVETTINFTDEDNFTVDLHLIGMGCSDDDIRAPQNLGINIVKTAGVSQGKAMLYLPRWQIEEGTKCTFVPTDASKVFIYTNFVGDDDGSSLSLHVMPITVEDAGDFDTYAASAFCDNFPSSCNSGYGFGDPNPVSTYTNPACVKVDSTDWGTACTSSNDLISTPTFSSTANWVLPRDLSELDIEVPEAIE